MIESPRWSGCARLSVAPVRLQRDGKGVRQRCLGDDVGQIDAEVNDRLGDLRTDPADDAVGAHEPRGGHCFQKMLSDQGVHRGYTGDIDNRDLGASVSTIFSSRLSITT